MAVYGCLLKQLESSGMHELSQAKLVVLCIIYSGEAKSYICGFRIVVRYCGVV